MTTREVPQEFWPTFFDDFSRQHEGEPMSIEYLGTEEGLKFGGRRLPLLGITAEKMDDQERPLIEIMLGDKPEAHLTHVIHEPVRVKVEQLDDGSEGALLIEGRDEPVTLLDFRPADRVPETGPGSAQGEL